MAGFRHVRRLHAYSGGSVPDSHRIHYSPLNANAQSGTQMRYSIVVIYYSHFLFESRVKIGSFLLIRFI